jgi:hypothetical protein
MFCARCGQQIPDASEICQVCGREATLIPSSPPFVTTQPFSNSPALNFTPAATPLSKQKEVGGWLMFFCILLTLVNPIYVLVMAWSGDYGIEFLFNIVWAAFGALVGRMVWGVQQRVFPLLWIYFGITALRIALAVANFISAEERVPVQEFILVFRSAIYSIAWFLYFKRSDRVKETFGRNL